MFKNDVSAWTQIDEWGNIGKHLLSSSVEQKSDPVSEKPAPPSNNYTDTAQNTSQPATAKSSCRGVYFDNIRHLWRANWPEETILIDRETKQPITIKRCTRTKGFSAKKYGYEESRRLAIEHRKEMITTGVVRHYVFTDEQPLRNCKKRKALDAVIDQPIPSTQATETDASEKTQVTQHFVPNGPKSDEPRYRSQQTQLAIEQPEQPKSFSAPLRSNADPEIRKTQYHRVYSGFGAKRFASEPGTYFGNPVMDAPGVCTVNPCYTQNSDKNKVYVCYNIDAYNPPNAYVQGWGSNTYREFHSFNEFPNHHGKKPSNDHGDNSGPNITPKQSGNAYYGGYRCKEEVFNEPEYRKHQQQQSHQNPQLASQQQQQSSASSTVGTTPLMAQKVSSLAQGSIVMPPSSPKESKEGLWVNDDHYDMFSSNENYNAAKHHSYYII